MILANLTSQTVDRSCGQFTLTSRARKSSGDVPGTTHSRVPASHSFVMSPPLSRPVIVGLHSAPDIGPSFSVMGDRVMNFRTIVSRLLPAPTRAACALVALLLAASPAAAQDWMEYAYPDLFFSVAFPAEPNVEMTTYQIADGRSLEARVYSVTRET